MLAKITLEFIKKLLIKALSVKMFGIIAGLTQDTLSDLNLAVHYGPDEVLVVDVTLAVLVAHEELLGLLVTQLFPEGGQKVPELRGADEPVPVLVKVA